MKATLGRVGRTAAGGFLVALGVVLIPLPGPGLLVVLAGLVVLARDYEWAKRLLARLRDKATRAGLALRRRSVAEPLEAPDISSIPAKEHLS